MRITTLALTTLFVLLSSPVYSQAFKNRENLSLEIKYNPEIILNPRKSMLVGNIFDGEDIDIEHRVYHNFSIGLLTNFKSDINYSLALLLSTNKFVETIKNLGFGVSSTAISYRNEVTKIGIATGPSFQITDKLNSKLVFEGGKIFYANNSYELIEPNSATPLSGDSFDKTEKENIYFASIKGEINRQVASNKTLDLYIGVSFRHSLTPIVYRMTNRKIHVFGAGLSLIVVI